MKHFYKSYKNVPSSFLPMIKNDDISTVFEHFKKCSICGKEYEIKGTGVISPYLMVIGMASSDYDKSTGCLFSDLPSRKINGMLEYISRSKDISNNTYLSCVKWCCNENRIFEEIKLINPKKILLLGKETAEFFGLGNDLDKLRCNTHSLMVHKYISTYVTYSLHEIFYLNGEVKLKVKEDLDYLIND